MTIVLKSALALCAITASVNAQFASRIASFNPGTGATADTSLILGGPTGGGLGGGSLDTLSLGVGGDVTLGFDVTITDGPGADFTVFENGFLFEFPEGQIGNFAEVAFVEVSTDGVNFARFESSYVGPAGPVPAFTPLPIGTFSGLAGGAPVVANVMIPSASPFDPVESGGDSFDLARLADDPAVTGGLVDLSEIHFVRLVDIPGGSVNDSGGNPIWDGDPAGSIDVDAMAVIQHTGNASADGPGLFLFTDALGYLYLDITDPDGLGDLDLTTLRGSFMTGLDLLPFGRRRIGALLPNASPLADGVRLRSAAPIVGSGMMGQLSFSVRDSSGDFSATQLLLQG